MLKRLGVAAKLAAIGLAAFTLAGCGINTIPAQDEQVKAAWGEVQNQYQRRADLIPNLVSTVQAYANQERDVLTAVTEARARATQVQVDASTITDPAAFRQFQAAQDQLSGVLGRLLAISERYPELRSNQNFLALQSQLEGTENRIAIARRDYNEAVRRYNTSLRTIPTSFWAATVHRWAKPAESFAATAGAERPPEVRFERPTPPAEQKQPAPAPQ
jgi:LemA protein